MNKAWILLGIVGVIMISLVAAAARNFVIETSGGSIVINSTQIWGSKMSCADIFGASYNVCTGTGAGSGNSTGLPVRAIGPYLYNISSAFTTDIYFNETYLNGTISSLMGTYDPTAADDFDGDNLTAQTSGWDKNSADDYATSDFNTDLANSGIRTSITNNITSVNNSMRPYVISTNASMKSYVDNNFIGSGGLWNLLNFTSALTATGLQASVTQNITSHAATFKHGNTTVEIRAQFIGSSNISIVNGMIMVNGSFGTGSASVDYSKVQNFTNYNCSAGEYVFGRAQNGSWYCRADQSGGAGGGGIWLDGGDFVYLNQSVATTINTTINYTQVLPCDSGEVLMAINGSYIELRTTPDNDYNIHFNYLNGTYSEDGDHYAVSYTHSDRGYSRGIQKFDLSSIGSQRINKITYRVYVDSITNVENKAYPDFYYKYNTSIYTHSDCNGNKPACWDSTTDFAYLTSWSNIMYYADNLESIVYQATAPPYIDIDVSDIVRNMQVAGNTTLAFQVRLNTDIGTNTSTNEIYALYRGYTAYWTPYIHFTSSIAAGETAHGTYDFFPGSKLMVWYGNSTKLENVCINEPSAVKYGASTSQPQKGIEIVKQQLNISGIYLNCSQIVFDSGFGSSSICDGVDATGASGDLDNTLINASRLDNATIIRNTNTSWITSLIGGAYNLANFTAHYALTAAWNKANTTAWYTPANTGYWQIANFSTAFALSGAWKTANQTEWYTTNGYSSANFTSEYNTRNQSLVNYVIYVNTTAKSYSDSVGQIINNSMRPYVISTNASMKSYVNAADQIINNTLKPYIISTNVSMASRVDYLDAFNLKNASDAKLNRLNVTVEFNVGPFRIIWNATTGQAEMGVI